MRRALIFLVAAALLGGVALRAPAELADRIAAVVADSVITSQQIDEAISQSVALKREQYRNDRDKLEESEQKLFSQGLEVLVDNQLILHDFDTSGFNFPDSIIDEIVQDRIRDRYGGDRVEFMKTLQTQGMTVEQFHKQIREEIIIDEMTSKYVPAPIISPHRIEEYYKIACLTNGFKVGDQVKTRMIVVNQSPAADPGTALRRAQDVLSRIRAGASFADMAKSYSDGSQRYEGGENGWQEIDVMNKALVGPLAKLKPGEYSDVIETPDTCFIILLEERRPAHFQALSEVRDEIEKTLKANKLADERSKWIERLKKKTFKVYF
jgi:peptidyl-prolyl cis-trans isomerase SurA